MGVLIQLQRQYLQYLTSLYNEGFLDDQFVQLQQLQDESNPDFVAEVVTLFFEDSERIINDLNAAIHLKCADFKKIDSNVHQLKGSSSSIGAQRVKLACINFRKFCDEQNVQQCLRCLHHVKDEYLAIKDKLTTLFRLEKQILSYGGSIPLLEMSK